MRGNVRSILAKKNVCILLCSGNITVKNAAPHSTRARASPGPSENRYVHYVKPRRRHTEGKGLPKRTL